MKSPAIAIPTFSLLLAVLAGGCGYERTPLAIDTGVPAAQIDEVIVLPVIDARPVTSDQVHLTRSVGDATVRHLRERGYFTLSADRFLSRPSVPMNLKLAGPDILIPLAPEDAKFFLLVQIESLEPGVARDGETFDVQLSGVLVDRIRGQVIWRDRATGSSNLSGMLTVFSRGSRQYEAAVNASEALVETLPNRRRKPKN